MFKLPISVLTNEKQMVSARINKIVYDEYKKSGIPISTVIEAGLIHFLKLENDEKVKFISRNVPETVEISDFKPIKKSWHKFVADYLVILGIPLVAATSLAIGPFTSIASLLTSGLLAKQVLKNIKK